MKAYFPLYQGDNWVRDTITAAMDNHIPCNRHFGEVLHFWSDYPQLVIREGKPWPDGRRNYSTPYNLEFNTLEEYEVLYQRLLSLFQKKGYVWSLQSSAGRLTRQNILPLSTPNYWYDDETDSYFYYEFNEELFPECLQHIFKMCKNHDKFYMMSDSGNTHRAGYESEERLKNLLKDNVVATAYSVFVAGDPLFMKDKFKMTRKEGLKLLGIIPCPEPLPKEPKVFEYPIKPCKGFPPHEKKVGWNPMDTRSSWYCDTYITEEEYKASLNK